MERPNPRRPLKTDIAGFGALLGLLLPLFMLIISLLLLYRVVRKGVTAGIKDYVHQHGDRAGSRRP